MIHAIPWTPTMRRPYKGLRCTALALAIVWCVITSCRFLTMTSTTANPKQGDNVTIEITAGESSDVQQVTYTIGSVSGTTSTVPKTVTINTCKTSGVYMTSIPMSGEVTYKDGEKITYSSSITLTRGSNTREDSDKNYTIYIADENDGKINDIRSAWANAFQDEFDRYSESQYYWAEPRFFTTQAISYANSADMTIFLGHGNHHHYRAGFHGADWVDMSQTEFGNFVPCYYNGDVEYLVSGACQLLSMLDDGGQTYDYYWWHRNATKLNKRPFSGLHMICGFRTNHHYSYWWWGRWRSSSEDFFEGFAERLDDGWSVRESWMDAADDELDFDDGNNRATVFYVHQYENDNLSTNHDDCIYGDADYVGWYETYVD